MSIEIEKKYRLTAEQARYVEDELAAVAANFTSEEFEENTIFGGGVLDSAGAIIRIRRMGSKNLLTFKRRIENEFDVKKQIEFESEVSDPKNMAAILSELGLKARLVYEKQRKTWRYREVEIVIDELPFGLFMEIEGSVTQISEAEIVLGVEGFEVEHETYPRLTARLGKRVGDVIEARFERDH